MTHARQRTLYGRTMPAMESRVLNEIPEENREWIGKPEPRAAQSGWGNSWSDEHFNQEAEIRSVLPGTRVARMSPLRKKPSVSSAPLMQLKPGESITHDAFGRGMVLSVRPMGNDALIEVAFDQVGTKKLMLKAASVHLKKE